LRIQQQLCDHTAKLVALIAAKREFSAYGPSHSAVLAVFAIAFVIRTAQ
jgi:hypothetical protein